MINDFVTVIDLVTYIVLIIIYRRDFCLHILRKLHSVNLDLDLFLSNNFFYTRAWFEKTKMKR